MMGRLVRDKGGSHLLRALPVASKRLNRELEALIIGDGPARNALEREAGRLGVRTRFTGWLPVEELQACLLEADLLAMPSLWPEPFGISGVEAGSLGIPAVGFSVGGIPDWLQPGVSGEMACASPPTSQGLADAIVRCLKDPVYYDRLRFGAWRLAKEYSLAVHVDRLARILFAHAGLDPASETTAEATRSVDQDSNMSRNRSA